LTDNKDGGYKARDTLLYSLLGECFMNKTELVAAVAAASGLTKAQAHSAIDAAVNVITDAMAKGDSVTLIGFGSFKVSERAARAGRNPQTGKEMTIAASKLPRFVAGKSLKDSVNN
jgi:nucleoid DNA-binding protein